MKLNHQSEKYFRNINQSDIILLSSENNCRSHLETIFTKITTRYSTSKRIKNAITRKPLFRKKPTFLSKLRLLEAITL